MPIKPENKALYPSNWKDISIDIRVNRAKNRCEKCDVLNYSLRCSDGYVPCEPPYKHPCGLSEYQAALEIKDDWNGWIDEYKVSVVVLTVAHLDHNPQNNDYSNLMALCQKCHNQHDIGHRKQTRKNTRNKGQLALNL